MTQARPCRIERSWICPGTTQPFMPSALLFRSKNKSEMMVIDAFACHIRQKLAFGRVLPISLRFGTAKLGRR